MITTYYYYLLLPLNPKQLTHTQVIHQTLDLQEAREAHRLMESGSVLGKLVLRTPQEAIIGSNNR